MGQLAGSLLVTVPGAALVTMGSDCWFLPMPNPLVAARQAERADPPPRESLGEFVLLGDL